jgi:RHS repeat-associated protein
MTAAGQPQVNYVYDNANRLCFEGQNGSPPTSCPSQSAGNVVIGYDADSRRTSLVLPNGVTVSYAYDADSHLTSISAINAGGTSIGDLTYSYDSAGRVYSVGGSSANAYIPAPLTATYNADSEPTKVNGTATSSDAIGDLLNDGYGDKFVWSVRGTLASMTYAGSTMSLHIDALGRRESMTFGGVTTSYLYDGASPVQEQLSSGGAANVFRGPGIDEIFSRTDASGTTSYFIRDGLGSTVALTDSSGTLQTQYRYEPFGNTYGGGTNTNPYDFVGRENDPLGLYYMRARYYAPYLMRFISPDPLGFGGGDTNLYRYVGNDPVDFTDPSGLKGSSSGGPVGGLDDPSDDRRNRGGKELPTGEQARPNEVDIPGGGQTTPLPLSVQTVFISSGLGGGLSFGGGLTLAGSPGSPELRKAPMLPKQPAGRGAFFACGGAFTAFIPELPVGCALTLGGCASGALPACGAAGIACGVYAGGIGLCYGAAFPNSRLGPPSKQLLPNQ